MKIKIRKIPMIFDIEKWLWKSNFDTNLQNSFENSLARIAINCELINIFQSFGFYLTSGTLSEQTTKDERKKLLNISKVFKTSFWQQFYIVVLGIAFFPLLFIYFPSSSWTFISLFPFYLDVYFPFLFGLFFPSLISLFLLFFKSSSILFQFL